MKAEISKRILLALGLAGLLFQVLLVPRALADAFVTVTPMNTARGLHEATLLPDGRVLVTGGVSTNAGGSLIGLASAEIFDPTVESWTTINPMTKLRQQFTATLLWNGKVLVSGGYDRNISGALKDAELYDPTNGTWTATGSLRTNRFSQTALRLTNGLVLVVGGLDNNSKPVKTVEFYDPSTETWTQTNGPGTERYNATATLLANGRVLVAGGQNTNLVRVSTAELFDPLSRTWTTTSSMNVSRAGHRATLLPDGRVLVAGGDLSTGTSCELYDPVSGTWANTGALNFAGGTEAVLLTNGTVLMAGGGTNNNFTVAEIFNPTSGTWMTTNGLSLSRFNFPTTLLPDGAVMVAGGNNGLPTFYSRTEIYGPVVAPQITVQPTNQTALAGDTVTFSVTTVGRGLNLQWRKDSVPLTNGVNVSGALSRTLILTNVSPGSAGVYSVVATNVAGSITSSNAVLTVGQLVTDPNLRAACYDALVTVGILPPPANPTGNYSLFFYIAFTHAGTTVGNLNAADLACFTALGITFTNGPLIINLEGMQYATNMENFALYSSVAGNSLTNLQQLAGQPHLTQLTLNNFPTPDLNSLTNVTQLKILALENDGLTNAAPLAALVNLTNLNLNFNSTFSDLDFASNLTQLKTLTANFDPIRNVSPLLGLTNLTQLQLAGTALTNVTLLGNLTNLTLLSLPFNGLTDVSFVASLQRLKNLDVSFNPLSDHSLGFLAGLTNLTELGVASDGLTNIAFLTGLKQLTQLSIQGNQLTDLTPLAGVTNSIRYLFLQNNELQNINVLTNLIGLLYVDLRNNYLDTNSNSSAAQVVQYLQSHGVTVDFLPQNTIVAPQITVQPANVTAFVGDTAMFTVTATGTSLSYFWQKTGNPLTNGLNLSGANTPSLVISNVTFADAGTYSVIVSNSANSITSTGAVLTVVAMPPQITVQPTNLTAIVSNTAVFSVTATGTSLSYFWQKDSSPLTNGLNLSGVDTPSLVISNVDFADAGIYSVIVSNSADSITSTDAVLTVTLMSPQITVQPANLTSIVGDPTVFTVEATGAEPLSYQWQKDSSPLTDDGENIFGATTSSLIISNTAFADAGVYSVIVSNSVDSVTSSNAVLTVVHLVPDPNLREASYEALVGMGILSPPANPTGNYYLNFYTGTTQPGITETNLNRADMACFTTLGMQLITGPLDLDLEGMQHATNMQNFALYADVAGGSLTNLHRLSGQTQLTQLTINNFLVPSLDALTNNTQLQNLQLESDGLINVAPLAALINLTNLDLNYNYTITDLDFAASLSQLQTLIANNNAVQDVSPLLGSASLTRIQLSANSPTNAALLGTKTNLTQLYLANDSLTDVGFVSNLVQLTSLDLSANPLSNPSLTCVAGLTNLTELRVHSDGVTNAVFLTGLTRLTELSIQGNQLADLTPMTGLTNLVVLDASYNLITDITPLAGLKALSSLYLNNNLITDVTPLAGLTNSLRYLFLQNNHLQNINALTNLTGLTYLDLRNNQLNTAPDSPSALVVQYLQGHGVTVDFLPQENLAATLSNPTLNGGQFSFVLTSQAGAAFQVQYSTNLMAWMPLFSVTNVNGSLTISNLPDVGPMGFFRLLGL